jgi:DNA polymerase III subunit alpha
VTVFNELFEQHRAIIREDRPLVILGQVQKDEFSGGLRVSAKEIYDLAAARAKFGRAIRLSMNGEANAKKLHDLLAPFRNGSLPVRVRYQKAGAQCEARLGDQWRVKPDDQLMASLNEWLTAENVEVLYA